MKGKVVRLMVDKAFGFIRGFDDAEYFFHKSDLHGFWDDLVNDYSRKQEIPVEFQPGETSRGLRAANVRRTDHPNEAT